MRGGMGTLGGGSGAVREQRIDHGQLPELFDDDWAEGVAAAAVLDDWVLDDWLLDEAVVLAESALAAVSVWLAAVMHPVSTRSPAAPVAPTMRRVRRAGCGRLRRAGAAGGFGAVGWGAGKVFIVRPVRGAILRGDRSRWIT